MPNHTRLSTCLPVFLALFFLAPAVGVDAASPFDALIGTGQVEEPIVIPDPELSEKFEEPLSYSIRYTRWTPEQPNGKVIVYNHGLQEHRGWFNATATELARLGYAVYAFDRIGSGESSDGMLHWHGDLIRSRGLFHDWKLLVDSLDGIVRRAQAQYPEGKIVLWGGGYGARVVTAYLLDRQETLTARGVTAAVFTSPGLFENDKQMPFPFSHAKMFMSAPQRMLPVPMVEADEDNGAGWFVAPGPWFDRIQHDELSLRDVARAFWIQTRKMDWYIDKLDDEIRYSVPTFHLMVRDDRVMDNEEMEKHLEERVGDGIFKYYSGGRGSKHYLLFTEDGRTAIEDVDAFLSGRRDRIADVLAPAAEES